MVERIVVVGGGASGVLAAAELLRQSTRPVSVVVVDPDAVLGAARPMERSRLLIS